MENGRWCCQWWYYFYITFIVLPYLHIDHFTNCRAAILFIDDDWKKNISFFDPPRRGYVGLDRGFKNRLGSINRKMNSLKNFKRNDYLKLFSFLRGCVQNMLTNPPPSICFSRFVCRYSAPTLTLWNLEKSIMFKARLVPKKFELEPSFVS